MPCDAYSYSTIFHILLSISISLTLIMKGIAFLFITCVLSFAAIANAALHSIMSDQDALVALKDHITHDPYQILAKNWSVGSSICDWTGVTCGKRHHRVTALDISNMGLTGTIPPHLGNLSFLGSINLGTNNFKGDMPNELAHLSRLKLLNFSVNSLTGEIPSSICSLGQLEYLYLYNNSFTGNIPSFLSNMSNLKILTIAQNQLSGSIPIEIFNISTLERLSLASNSLSGNLPISMCRNLQKLKGINLRKNILDGLLPSDLSYCSQLSVIYFSYNNFSGSVPEEFWNMKKLEEAYMQSNSLEGTIPKDITNLTNLQYIDLRTNRLTGVIPKEIGNLTLLIQFSIAENNLRGTIPQEFGSLVNLDILDLSTNGMSGSIPAGLFNLSTLRQLALFENYLSGTLPSATGFGLPNLEYFSVYKNRLNGVVPLFLSNSSSIHTLVLAFNSFTGVIPHFLGNLRLLEFLNLEFNLFTRDYSSSLELDFLRPLSNCKYLTYLGFYSNPLGGILPKSVGNLSKTIEIIEVSACGLSGEISAGIGNLSNLLVFAFEYNHFSGSIPTSIASLQKLQALALDNNKLSGILSCNLFGLKRLSLLYLHNNMFSGTIPECVGNSTSLRKLSLQGNNFSSSIPMSLWNMKDLLELNLSSNFLNGSLPVQLGNLKVLTLLDLSLNNLSGDIPETIGLLQNLVNLSLAYNLFQGSIPESVGNIVSLEYLDLSKNILSGLIPVTIEKLKYLKFFNVSDNHLSGLIPSGGAFLNFTYESFMFNKDLCGDKRFRVPPCPSTSPKKSWIERPKHIRILCFSLISASIAAITLVVYIVIFRRKKRVQKSEQLLVTGKDRISFYELQHATDRYSERNLLGQGSFGSVYKATLRDGRVVAVKVFNIQAEGGLKSFDVECEILRNLRHRNLTQVISSCSNLDFKAIVLEFMPNGTLDNWLHSENHFLSFTERLNIMIDVASALQYLHSGYQTPVVHADLKPSNILLNQSKVAHVSDFGIAKMLEGSSITYTNTLATFGYIAPEYGSEGLVSTRCDVYSFGIILIEVFTRKRPHDEMFNESLTMPVWMNNYSTMNELAEIIDDGLLNMVEDEQFALMMDCAVMIMNTALKCTKTFPRERSDIGEVLATLNKIKLKL